MSDYSRREFLKTAEVAAAGLALGACKTEQANPYELKKPPVPGAAGWYHGQEKFVTSSCSQCSAGCGIRVRVDEGRAVRIEGNPAFPLNQAGLGPKGQSGLEVLYHADRLRGPMKRVGPRGSGQWAPVPWDAAIADIGGQLRAIKAAGNAEGLVVLDGEPRGMMTDLWRRFVLAFGSPNHVDHRSVTDGGKQLAMAYMHGVADLPAYDWEKTNYVLGFGASLYESWCQTIHMTRTPSRMRHATPGQRVKFVQVSPRCSLTAAKADEWVPIVPVTEGALALGLAHVLVRDKLYDAEFVAEHCFGFEDWKDDKGQSHRGFRALLAEKYSPEWASKITGVSVATITRLAHEMAEHRPALAVADGAAAAATNGLGTAMAIHALNALLGNLERPGGMLVQRPAPLLHWKPLDAQGNGSSDSKDAKDAKDAIAARLDGAGTAERPLAQSYIQGLPEAILGKKPYAAQALFLYRSNPVYSKPDGARWIEAIKQVPLVVSFSPLADESTFWADYLLPDHSYLERWDLVVPVPSNGTPVLGLRQPVVPALYDTKPTGDVLLQIAKAVGAPLDAALPWKDYKEAVMERAAGLSAVGNAESNVSESLEKHGGWWAERAPLEAWDTAFATPSKRFEFHSQTIAARLVEAFPVAADLEKHLVAQGVLARGDELCQPHWEAPRFAGDESAYPMLLVPYRDGAYAEGGVRHLPLLRELALAGHSGWRERLDLNPKDAAHLGLIEGERILVESPAGARTLRVNLSPGIRPGTAGLPLGYGTWPPEPSSAEVAGGYGLIANASDPLAGILALSGTRIRIRKA